MVKGGWEKVYKSLRQETEKNYEGSRLPDQFTHTVLMELMVPTLRVLYYLKNHRQGAPAVAQWNRQCIRSTGTWVQSPSPAQWAKDLVLPQQQLGGDWGLDLIPGLGTPYVLEQPKMGAGGIKKTPQMGHSKREEGKADISIFPCKNMTKSTRCRRYRARWEQWISLELRHLRDFWTGTKSIPREWQKEKTHQETGRKGSFLTAQWRGRFGRKKQHNVGWGRQ